MWFSLLRCRYQNLSKTRATLTGTVEMAGFNGDRELESIARAIGGSQSKKLMRGIKGIYLASVEIGLTEIRLTKRSSYPRGATSEAEAHS